MRGALVAAAALWVVEVLPVLVPVLEAWLEVEPLCEAMSVAVDEWLSVVLCEAESVWLEVCESVWVEVCEASVPVVVAEAPVSYCRVSKNTYQTHKIGGWDERESRRWKYRWKRRWRRRSQRWRECRQRRSQQRQRRE